MLSNIENLIGTAYGDELTGDDGDNILEGGGGADILDARAGVDTASYAGAAAGVIAYIDGTVGTAGDATGDVLTNFENITGSAHNDTLTGNAGNNVIDGGVR